ncbi:glycosyltransferase [Amycolatopsis sp.]|uniref:glycosyltransferase n=1 Tax=Amycolatopsis sp. TaxID=37632 RepID=UPI002E05624D|nr:glycosyltransferase [Amycolatopsis sp.]
MRLIFASLASHGHIYPLIPLALAAKDAGHDVVFATSEEFLAPLRKAGLEVAAAGLPIRAAFGKLHGGIPESRTPEQLNEMISEVFGEIMPRQVMQDLKPLLDVIRPDLVVHEAGNPGAAVAAWKAGIPGLCHGFGRESASPVVAVIGDRMRAFAAEQGLDLPGDYPAAAGNRYLDICPPSWQTPEFKAAVDRIELRPVAWNEPGELPSGVRYRKRPLVYLTLGTAMGNALVLRQAIEGLAKLPVDVLVASGPSLTDVDLGEMPGNVRLEAWVPQGDLLPHVDLVVHHGGSGTTLGALAAGKVQLCIPQGADQFTNAEALVAAGACAVLLPGELNADAVTELARRLLADEAMQAVAHRFRDEIAEMPSPESIVARLPKLAELARVGGS